MPTAAWGEFPQEDPPAEAVRARAGTGARRRKNAAAARGGRWRDHPRDLRRGRRARKSRAARAAPRYPGQHNTHKAKSRRGPHRVATCRRQSWACSTGVVCRLRGTQPSGIGCDACKMPTPKCAADRTFLLVYRESDFFPLGSIAPPSLWASSTTRYV